MDKKEFWRIMEEIMKKQKKRQRSKGFNLNMKSERSWTADEVNALTHFTLWGERTWKVNQK